MVSRLEFFAQPNFCDGPPKLLHYSVFSAEVILMVSMSLQILDPLKRALASGEELFLDRHLDLEVR